MPRPWLTAVIMAVFATFISVHAAYAHCIVGNRFFPATLNVDDPCVADELQHTRTLV
jgi:hypothetical protein